MDSGCFFRELKIKDWNFITIDKHDHHRLYFLAHEPAAKDYNNGFKFNAVRFVQCDGKYENIWDDPDLRVELTLHGTAYFDGVRHLYLNWGEDEGYLYYPEIHELRRVLEELEKLQKDFCPESSG